MPEPSRAFRRTLSVRLTAEDWERLVVLSVATGRTKTDLVSDLVNILYFDLLSDQNYKAGRYDTDVPRRYLWESYASTCQHLADDRWTGER